MIMYDCGFDRDITKTNYYYYNDYYCSSNKYTQLEVVDKEEKNK